MSARPADPVVATFQRCRTGAGAEDEPRKPGRPLKRTEDYYRQLLAAHARAEAWFIAANARRPKSVQQLYTAYFAQKLAEYSERPSRASGSQFQRGIKTLRNELSEARRLLRRPENDSFSGTTTTA
jgi:hypothetical protein